MPYYSLSIQIVADALYIFLCKNQYHRTQLLITIPLDFTSGNAELNTQIFGYFGEYFLGFIIRCV